MLLNKYIIIGVLFIVFNSVSLLIGTVVTYVDWAIIFFLSLDTEMEQNATIPYLLILGFLNDFFNSFFFGVTPLVFIIILIIRSIFARNFNFSELRNVRYAYFLTAVLIYVTIILLSTGYRESPFVSSLFLHFGMDMIFLLLLKPLVEKKIVI